MKLYLKQSHYKDEIRCCTNSLFERGKRQEGTARGDHIEVDDWAYLDFPTKWVYVNGFEAPMGNMNYQELHLKHPNDTQWTEIDSQRENECFHDNPIHYPVSPSGEIFVASSDIRNYDDENKDYDFFLWIFTHERNQWKLQKKIEIDDWFRVLDFSTDGKRLFLFSNWKIRAISMLDYSIKTILEEKYGKTYFTNAHLSADKNFLLVVSLSKNKQLRYHLIELSKYEQIMLSRGMNNVKDEIFDIPVEVKIPLAVDNGSVMLTISKK